MKKILLFVLMLSFQFSIGQTLPVGFTQQLLAQNLDPTDLVLTPDGRVLITIKSGKILVVENGVLLPTPFLDITASVDNNNERGLGHIVLDPAFESNNFYYIYYTVIGVNYNRISRFTANGNSTLGGSEMILMNLDPLNSSVHNAGDMVFGPDGKLYVATGEAGFQDNAQVMTNVLGKVLRINSDGSIPQDNPFYTTNTGKNRAIYTWGHRNPYSMDIQPGTGRIFVSEVGQYTWEEINEIHAGMNYGWPLIEGVRTNQTPPDDYMDPVFAYNHTTGANPGCAVVGAAFYNPVNAVFPVQYVGKFFYADYCSGYMRYLDPNTGVSQPFATGINRPLAIVVAPDGSMYYMGLGGGNDNTSTTNGTLWRVTYTGSGVPTIGSQPQSTTGLIGDNVNFVVSASGAQPLTYQWKLNGVDIPGANSAMYTFPVTSIIDNGKSFTCRVTNALGNITSAAAILTVINNTRPVPVMSVTLPAGATLYQAGQTLQFIGGATDAEDGNLPASKLTWKIDFHHNVHLHPALPATSGVASGSFDIPRVGETSDDVWYRVILTATDNLGFSTSIYQDVYPQKIDITLTTSPPNLTILLDGQTIQTPFTFKSVVGATRSLEAPVSQSPGGILHSYSSWSDQSLTRLFTFDTPQQNKTYNANYEVLVVGNGNGLTAEYRNIAGFGEANGSNPFGSALILSRIDPTINFNWGAGSPSSSPQITNDNFVVRWTGEVLPQFSQTYQFYTNSDDGVRLYVDNVLLIEGWPLVSGEQTGSIWLEAGQRYRIRMEYVELTGGASAKLEWSSQSTARQVIPQSQLFSAPVPRRMVALGSSTAAGIVGPSVIDSAWVSRFNRYYKTQAGIVDFTYNLGVGGTTPYKAMPSSYVNGVHPDHPNNPTVPDQPDPLHNVTEAISLLKNLSVPSNGVVIVNFPSNGYDYMSVNEIIDVLQVIYDSATRKGNKCFITTTQPRQDVPFNSPAMREKLAQIKDAIIQRFGVDRTINFWDGMYNPADGTILPIYSAGDGIHFNNAGHRVLFERVLAKNVFDLSLPNQGEYRSNVATSGNWSAAASWLVGDGTIWKTATSPPGTNSKLITIKGGNRIDITAPLTVNGSIMIRSLGTLSAGANNINVKGNWINNGSFLAGTGTVTFDGTAAQSIGGSAVTDFTNILVSNTTNVQVQNSQNLKGVLTLGTNAKFDADGSANTSVFKLFSQADNPTQDAAIAALPAGAVVDGKVTVQRFMALEGTNSRMYRYISSPVENGTVADVQNEIPITGPFSGSNGPSRSMFYYDEAVTTDINGTGTADLADGYIGFPSANNLETFSSGRGYSIYVRGDMLSTAQWDITGPIKQGNTTPVSFPVTFTSANGTADDGWNLVGNPFASAIDWNASGWTKTNVEGSVYFRDNGASPVRVASYNGSVGNNGGSRYIATGQAFWVKANGVGVPVLTANENVKAPTTPTTFFRESDPDNVFRIILSKDFVEDEAVVHFREDATPSFDHRADAWKLLSGTFNLSTLTKDAERLSINSWSSLTCNTSIALSIDNAGVGFYALKFSGSQSFESGVSFSLQDNFLNKTVVVDEDHPYIFSISADEKSKNANRFTLLVNKEPNPIVIEERHGELSIEEGNDIQWYFDGDIIPGANASILHPTESGTYSVVISKNGCQLTGSREYLVTGTEPALRDGISIYPNPTKDEFFIRVENKQPVNQASITNALGRKIGTVDFVFSGGVSSGNFSLNNEASGVYFVKCPIGQKIVTVKIIKK
jgi:glucose/arabinose dehydrogenase